MMLPHRRNLTLESSAVNKPSHLFRGGLCVRHSLCFATAMVFAVCSVAPAADLPPAIPNALKQATNLTLAQHQQIDAAVAGIAKTLADPPDPTVQSVDRKWLADQVLDAAGAAASADFLHAYAKSVNDHLLPIASAPSANFRAKLEAGLAAAKITHSAGSADLAPLATALLRDPSPAIALAGMKAAAELIPVVISHPIGAPETQLLNQVVATIGANPAPPLGGPIVDTAYHALFQPILAKNAGNARNIANVLVPLLLTLEHQRLALFKGTTPPESPQSDSTGLFIFFDRDVWLGGGGIPQMSSSTRKEVLNLTADLIELSAKWAKTPGATKADFSPFLDGLKTDGSELKIFANPNNGVLQDPDLIAAALKLAAVYPQVGPSSIGTSADDTAAVLQRLATSNP
jgi:hypothetical protein